MALSFAEQGHDDDRWYPARVLAEMCASKWVDVLTPGYKMTVDESMFAWDGRGGTLGGMPTVMKIKRKPKGVGCEVKTLADVASGIMVNLEINEGKEAMKEKRWQRELGAGTATTLRLSEPWHGSGRIVCGDSWFASVKTAIELRRKGLFFTGIVKTAHRMFPLKALGVHCPLERGSTVTATAVEDGIDIIAHGWRDRKVHRFVSTCGTTLQGTPAKKRRYDDDGKVFFKEVQRTKLAEEYYDGAPALDIHNHIRQDGLSLETIWRTERWHHRFFAAMFGIIETNAFLAFNYFRTSGQKAEHSAFTHNIALQLIKNPWQSMLLSPEIPPIHQNVATTNTGNHVLASLSANSDRQRVQRKCIICSRVHHRQQKASWYCVECGNKAVLCSPNTGRTCFQYHIQNGLPP